MKLQMLGRVEKKVSLLFKHLDTEIGECILFAKLANTGKKSFGISNVCIYLFLNYERAEMLFGY